MNLIRKFWKSAPTEAPLYLARCEVLLVEDVDAEAEFLDGLLRLQNAVVTRAKTIGGALEAIGSNRQFQLAFVDLNLAHSSAVEVVRRIKEAKRYTHCIIVSADFEKIQLCLHWGYIGILLKPFTVGAIREVLRAHRLPTSD